MARSYKWNTSQRLGPIWAMWTMTDGLRRKVWVRVLKSITKVIKVTKVVKVAKIIEQNGKRKS